MPKRRAAMMSRTPTVMALSATLNTGKVYTVPRKSAPRLSVVVPTRNEAANLCQLRGELERALAGVDHEVIVVDDSADATKSRSVISRSVGPRQEPTLRLRISS